MLVLSQSAGSYTELTIPPSTTPTVIRKTVIRIGPNKVRDGWDAPREVNIVRGELIDKPPTRLGESEND